MANCGKGIAHVGTYKTKRRRALLEGQPARECSCCGAKTYNAMLCDWCYQNENEIPEIAIEDGRLEGLIAACVAYEKKAEAAMKKKATVYDAKNFTQEELQALANPGRRP